MGTCATLCLTGCFTVNKATLPKTGEEHVTMQNYGWKFFDWIPLFSGNASEDATCGCVIFRDDVTMEKVQARMVKYANGRQIHDEIYDNNNSVFFNLFGIPIPYLITYNEINVSGVMK